MSQISQFLRSANGAIGHFCPACLDLHVLCVKTQWAWDGNVIEPTLTPAITVQCVKGKKIFSRCHYTLIRGYIKYQEDCTHPLAGLTMKLPALPEFLRDKCLV